MNRQITIGLISAALVVAAPFAHAQLGPPPAKFDLIKVRDDIYVISNVAVPGLTTALITNEGVLLVDDKFDADHDNIMKVLKTVTNQPVKLDFDTVIPGHGLVSTKKDLQDYHQRTINFSETLSQLVKQGTSKADIERVVRTQFAWEDFHVQSALDGLINEFK